MSYNYLGLVNDVNRRLNEVELTSVTFPNALGFYSLAKDAVNSALNTINHQEFEWPFNHNTLEEVVTAGTNRYSLPAAAKTADWDTFRIKRDDTLSVETKKLTKISYEEYLERHLDDEYNTATSVRSIPKYVFRTPDNKYGLHPVPDKAYTVVFEYFSLPTQLDLYSDVPTVPEMFRHVIVDGAMYHAHMFRGDNESSQLSLQRFESGLKDMRVIYINRYDYIRSTVVQRLTN